MIIPHLDPAATLVIDANFPGDVLLAMAKAVEGRRQVFAAGTSIGKVARLRPCLRYLHALVLNRGEAACLAGSDNAPAHMLAQDLASDLADGGVVLVSDGGAEAALASRAGVVTLEPPQFQVVNASGAGDAMAASLFWGLETGLGPALDARLQVALAAGAEFAAGPPLPDPA